MEKIFPYKSDKKKSGKIYTYKSEIKSGKIDAYFTLTYSCIQCIRIDEIVKYSF